MNQTYRKVIMADSLFEAAIKRQFGRKINRFDVTPAMFNEETVLAYKAKLAADEAWLAEMRKKNKSQ